MATGPSNASGRSEHDATYEAAQTARKEAHLMKDQAREALTEAKEGARETAETVKTQMHSSAAKQKGVAAEQMEGWAHALKSASDDLESRGQGTAAACVRQASAGLERVSGTVRDRSVDDLIGTVEDFARRQPVAFFGGAVVAGFGIARFMKSSADRRRDTARGPGGYPIREGGEL